MGARAAIVVALLAACDGGKSPKMDAGSNGERVEVLSARASREVDLLFVIDDSASMSDKQNALVANFPSFIQPLEGLVGGLPNLHLGVITTDMGTKGTGSDTPGPGIGAVGQGGCGGAGKNGTLSVNGANVAGTFVTDIANASGGRERNYTGTLSDVFSTMARVGQTGCGFEQPLHAMKVALSGQNPANQGFLRDNALLAVLFLTDEDDCSIKDPMVLSPDTTMFGQIASFRCVRFGVRCAVNGTTPDEMNTLGPKDQCRDAPDSPYIDAVQPYHDFLLGLKGGDASRVVVAGLIGPPTPVVVEERNEGGVIRTAVQRTCDPNGDGTLVGDPGIRLQQFFDIFTGQNVSSSICEIQNGGAAQIGQLVAAKVGGTCITRPIADSDESVPGVQPDCEVEDVLGDAVAPISHCDSGGTPCWDLIVDPGRCPAAQNFDLRIQRDAPPDPATVTKMRCRVP